MTLIAGHAIGLFGAVWAVICVIASALATDTLLKTTPEAPRTGPAGVADRR